MSNQQERKLYRGFLQPPNLTSLASRNSYCQPQISPAELRIEKASKANESNGQYAIKITVFFSNI